MVVAFLGGMLRENRDDRRSYQRSKSSKIKTRRQATGERGGEMGEQRVESQEGEGEGRGARALYRAPVVDTGSPPQTRQAESSPFRLLPSCAGFFIATLVLARCWIYHQTFFEDLDGPAPRLLTSQLYYASCQCFSPPFHPKDLHFRR